MSRTVVETAAPVKPVAITLKDGLHSNAVMEGQEMATFTDLLRDHLKVDLVIIPRM